MIEILVVGLSIEFVMAVLLARNDVLHSSVVVSGVMCMGAFLAKYLLDTSWEGMKIYGNTVCYILVAVLFYIITENIIKFFFPFKGKGAQLEYISVEFIKLAVVTVVGMLVFFWHLRFVITSAGLSTFKEISVYRQLRLYSNTIHLPRFLSYGRRFLTCSSYILLYIYINNLVVSRQYKRNIGLLFPSVICAFDEFIEGGRMEIVRIVIFAGIVFYILLQRNKGWHYSFSFKNILKLGVAGILFMVVFTGLGQMLGRKSSTQGVLYNIAFYGGGGTILLDRFLNDSKIVSPFPGYLTLAKMYADIARRFGIEKYNYVPDMEFRTFNGISLGNCYTVLRPYIQDFGLAGMLILVCIFSAFFTIYYYRLKTQKRSKKFDFKLMFFGYMFLGPCLFGFDEYFLYDFFTIGTITFLIEFWIVKIFLLDFHIRHGAKVVIVTLPKTLKSI